MKFQILLFTLQDGIHAREDAAGDGVRGDGHQDAREPGQFLVPKVLHSELPGAGAGAGQEAQRQVSRTERSVAPTRVRESRD